MQIDPSTLSRANAYHFLISAIVPRPIAFVSTADARGHTNAAPFSYFTGVSSSPPSLLICSGRRRDGIKDTQRNIVATREFVVNVVVEEMMNAVAIAGVDHPPGTSEFEMTGLTPAPSVKVAAPRIAESPVNLECRLLEIHEVAGTAIIVGEVVWIHLRDDLVATSPDGAEGTSGHVIDIGRLRPIARLGGDGYTRLGEVFEKKG